MRLNRPIQLGADGEIILFAKCRNLKGKLAYSGPELERVKAIESAERGKIAGRDRGSLRGGPRGSVRMTFTVKVLSTRLLVMCCRGI